MARCPAHGDAHQSLSVGIGKDGRVLLKCHAGCTTADIAGAMGLTMKDLFVEPPKQSEKPRVTATYDYRDAAGNLLAQKLRKADKSFSWRRPDGRGGWIYNRQGVPHRLYVAGQMSSVVYVTEGEKDANNLHEKVGGCAVSGADGAGPGKWKPEYTEQLRDRSVVILQDNDDVGRAYAQETAAALHGTAKSVRLLDLSTVWPDIPEHGDVSDMISALGAEEAARRLVKLSRETPEWTPGSFEGFEGEAGTKTENGFLGFLEFLGPDIKKNPHFPAAEFPRVLRNFAVNVGASMQVSVDMASVSALAASSLCAQRKFKVHTQNNWFEPVNLYSVIIAKPSERKSPTISVVMNPVYKFQQEENERRRAQVEEYRTRKDMLQRRIESMKKSATSGRKAKNDSPATVDDIMMLYHELEDLEKEPVDYISLTADDITMEALVSEMAANHETMALVSSEGGIFNVMSGLYSGGVVNIDIILKSWSGDYVKVNRKGRPPETLLHPSLVILLMTQPRVLEAVMKSVDFAGRGLNARFLYSIPASPVGTRTFKAPPIPQEVMDEYDDLIYRLLSIPDTGEPRIIEMTDEARSELEKIHNDIEPRLGAGGDLELLEDWGGKFVGTVVRIAGLLHICDHVEEAAEIPIPGETIRRAGKIGEYFLAHAICAYQIAGQMDDQPTKDAKYILKKLDSTGKTEISKSELQQLCKERVGLETAEQMEPGLEVLVKRGYIKIEKAHTSKNPKNPKNHKKGGRPSYMIYVNPIYTAMKEGKAHVA